MQVGDPVLREKAKPVAKKDIGSRKLAGIIKRMQTLLKKEEFGVAIAAPQIGEPQRMFIIAGRVFAADTEAPEKKETPPPMIFINPELIRLSKKKKEMSEGCLSVRGKYGTVVRHEKASVKALNELGKPFTYHGAGLVAHIFQHECDHLDGILYIDKAVKLETDEKREELRKEFPPE